MVTAVTAYPMPTWILLAVDRDVAVAVHLGVEHR
jgi:hypothetical protein